MKFGANFPIFKCSTFHIIPPGTRNEKEPNKKNECETKGGDYTL